MRAEKTGNRFEQQVDLAIQSDGFTRCGNDLWRLYTLGFLPPGKYYQRHADVGLSAVGGKSHRLVDILLINSLVTPPFIHCYEDKWQQSSGSTDRKIDSVVNDAVYTYKHSHLETTIICGGPRFNPDRIAWLKRQVTQVKGLYAVISLEEFIAEINRGCLNGGPIVTRVPALPPEYVNAAIAWPEDSEESIM